MGWEQTASGYAAVWASENTREAIFDAMERRETYAATGPRMLVRFFAGYDFTAADANTRSPAMIGYTRGVPTGADLGPAPAGSAFYDFSVEDELTPPNFGRNARGTPAKATITPAPNFEPYGGAYTTLF